MYVIGLIDDEESQIKAMRRTIKVNAPREDYAFKSYYPLPSDSNKLVDEVFNQVLTDIINDVITCLIIDYKIMVQTTKIKGTEIFRKIKNTVPKFPIIILTEVVSESIEPKFIDADKVYKKREFFKIEEEYSKEKVYNIFDSMYKYVEQRESLQLELEKLQKQLASGEIGQEGIHSVLKIENELDSFVPTEQTQIDKVFDADKAKHIIELIEKANNLLE